MHPRVDRRLARRAALAAAVPLALPLVVWGPGGAAQAAPQPIAPNEWSRTVLTADVVDPTDLDVAPDGTVVIGERTGAIKVWKQDGTLKTAGTIPVSANISFTEVAEDALEEGGIHGILLDKDFLRTRRFYAHYSVPNSVNATTGEGVFRVSTFVLTKDDKLVLGSEKKILEVPAEWDHCCHYGGDMERMADGTILLTVGDDTSPREEGWNPRDKRPDRKAFNAERTSQNPKDRRGKVLRFNPDGSVPKNNPYATNRAYDPYVYAMGFRSNYRMGHDQKTGATFVGNVGPDSRAADPTRGPQGYDELEIVPKGGRTNHGWPRCIANNVAYQDYDYATATSKGPLSCAGMTPAAIYYDYNYSTQFPLVGTGSRTSIGGPVYRYSGTGALKLPDAFQGKLIHWDWSRSIMWLTPVRADGTLDTASITPWAAGAPNTFVGLGEAVPAGGPSGALEAVVGPDGALYVAEYGTGYYQNNNSAISRITCFQCTPSADDYAGAPTDPQAGSPQPSGSGPTTSGRDTGGGVLAATGGPTGLAVLGLVGLLTAMTLRRRVRHPADASGL